MTERPQYDGYRDFSVSRSELATKLAAQVLATTAPWLPGAPEDLDVLDAGSGYGGTSIALSRQCRSVVGLEPASALYATALAALESDPRNNVSFVNARLEDLRHTNAFDLVVLDNVYEHLPHQAASLEAVSRAMKPGGVMYLLVPNRLWPIEAHYDLPFLSWLPLRWANRYLRMSGRGTSYEDASYAPTYWGLQRSLRAQGFKFEFVLPGDPSATVSGAPVHYRLGMALLRRFPSLWCISKALLVVAIKE